MIVMDGDSAIAKVHKVALGGWVLQAVDGCWVDPRARRSLREDFPPGFKALWPQYPQYMWIKTKTETRRILKSVLKTGNVKNKAPD